MCDLDKYKILYQAYADEIKNLWQRSVFLGAFMTLAWGGYGALQLKMIEKGTNSLCIYHFASLGLCVVIIILSLLWVAMAKGSKFVQEAHEAHIDNLNLDEIKEPNSNANKHKRLFCILSDYETKLKKQDKLSEKLFVNGALKAYRYSPSRINIALGWFSVLMAMMLGIVHIIAVLGYWILLVSIPILSICYIKPREQHLKSSKQNQPQIAYRILSISIFVVSFISMFVVYLACVIITFLKQHLKSNK